ncbi:MAG: hypothetical protein ACE5FU_12470 [Nitrospinota bacterium]
MKRLFLNFPASLFLLGFLVVSVLPQGFAETVSQNSPNKLTLRKSTVEGGVEGSMEIRLINLEKNRREKILEQLEKKIRIRKVFSPQKQRSSRGDEMSGKRE